MSFVMAAIVKDMSKNRHKFRSAPILIRIYSFLAEFERV